MTFNSYTVLGINSDATQAEIKSQWRKLCQINHPDRCPLPTADHTLAAINAAYTWLTGKGRYPTISLEGVHVYYTSAQRDAAVAEFLNPTPKAEPEQPKAEQKPRRRNVTATFRAWVAEAAEYHDSFLFSVEYAAMDTGLTERQVRGAIDTLRSKGYTFVAEGRGWFRFNQ